MNKTIVTIFKTVPEFNVIAFIIAPVLIIFASCNA
jgi:hypothetical protein